MTEKELIVSSPISNALTTIRKFEILKSEDYNFLIENKSHLCKVFEKNYIWRTQWQKESIISDYYHPTDHSKFHQAMTEQKVQTEQLFYLLKDVELKKLDLEEVIIDIEELEATEPSSKKEIKLKRLNIDRDFKTYELQQLKVVVHYRMEEIRGWQEILNRLIDKMTAEGHDDSFIWDKNLGEIEDMFFSVLNNYQGIKNSTDGAEANNLRALASFAIKQVKEMGLFETLLKKCNALQLQSLEMLGMIQIHTTESSI
jgi:hypothetical protein